MITGLGISTMCENLIIIAFSSRFRVYPVNFSSESINILGATVGQVDLIIFAVSIAALICVELFIRRSRAGLAIRGASFDLDATLMGSQCAEIDFDRIFDCGNAGRPGGSPFGELNTRPFQPWELL